MATQKEQAQIDVIINGQKANATIGDMEKGVKALSLQIKNLQPDSDAFIKKSQEFQKAKAKLDDVKTSAFGVSNATKGMLGEMSKLGPAGSMIQSVTGGFQNLIGGIATATKAFFTLGGAVAATGIGLLLIAFSALISYFKSTDEGADMLERGLSGVKAVVDVLTGVLSQFGKAAVAVFQNPKKAALDLVDFVKQNVINRFTAFKVIIDGLLDLDFEKTTNGVIQLSTGISDATGKAKKLGDEMEKIAIEAKAAADAAMELTRRSQDLEDSEAKLSAINSERSIELDKLTLKNKEQTLSGKERVNALREAGKIEKDMSTDAIKLAQERLDIEKAKNDEALKANKIGLDKREEGSNFKAEIEAQVALNNLKRESGVLQQTIANKESAFIKQLSDERKKAIEEERKTQEDIRKNMQKLEMDVLDDTLDNRIKKLEIQSKEEINVLKGTEEQKAQQRTLIEQKLQKDISALQDASEKERQKKVEEEIKAELEATKKAEIAKSDVELMMSEGNSQMFLDATKNRIELERKLALDNESLTAEEKEKINVEADKKRSDAEKAKRDADLAAAKQMADQIAGYSTQGISDVEAFSHIANDRQLKRNDIVAQQNSKNLDAELAARKISTEKYESLKQSLENDTDQKSKLIKNKQAQGDKRAAIAQALIAIPLAIIKSLPNIPLSIASGVIAGINLAKIIATPPPTYKRGGVISGSKHGSAYGVGGIALIDRLTGREHGEMQGNEIILSEGVTNNQRLRAAASRINVAGGGRSFEDGGSLGINSGAGSSASATFSKTDPMLLKLDEINSSLKGLPTKFRVFVVYSDISDAAQVVTEITNESKNG